MTTEAQKAPEAYQQIILKAWKDPAFREALRADPRGVLQRELGTALPDGVDIEVVEETPTKVYFVIPAMPPALDDRELSDEELGAVAGGVGGSVPTAPVLQMQGAIVTPKMMGTSSRPAYSVSGPGNIGY